MGGLSFNVLDCDETKPRDTAAVEVERKQHPLLRSCESQGGAGCLQD